MANVIPYRAFFYASKFSDKLGNLISPPYDVISPTEHLKLVEQHPLNSVGLCLPDSNDAPDRYRQIKARFEEWKREDVFETAAHPSYYLLEENFKVGGKPHRRIGFVGLLEVVPFEAKQVLPHEYTLSGPKQDRLELLRNIRAELSQIFLCYQDPKFILEDIYSRKSLIQPFRECTDPAGVHRKLWIIDSAEEVEVIGNLMQSHTLLIADGHHRYETALAFKNEDASVASKYAQCYFTNLSTPGFTILPIHRLFSLPVEMAPENFRKQLEERFEIQPFKYPLDLETLVRKKAENPESIQLLLAFRNESEILLLSRPKKNADDAEIFAIQKDIFEGILNWDIQKLAKGIIRYEHETEAFKKTLQSLPYGIGLFLPPTDLNLVMRLARDGVRMPQKSTFFFPKLASGLVNYEMSTFED